MQGVRVVAACGLMIAAISVAACGEHAGATIPTSPSPTDATAQASAAPASLVGTWQGTTSQKTDVNDGTFVLTVTAAQADGTVKGTVTWTSLRNGKSYSGQVTGLWPNLTVSDPIFKCRVNLLAMLTPITLGAPWTGYDGCAGSAGVLMAYRVP